MLGTLSRINFCVACFPSSLGALLLCAPLGWAAPHPMTITERLTEWKTLTAPNAPAFPAQRYADFLQQSPPWPLQNRVEWRYQNALAQETNVDTLRTLCPSRPLSQLTPFLTCEAFLPHPDDSARHLWIETLTTSEEENLFLTHHQALLTPDNQWNRYLRLERQGHKTSAQRQITRLSAEARPKAQARWGYRFNATDADTPSAQQISLHDAAVLFYRLKWLRQKNRLDEAYQLWQQIGLATEQTVSQPKPLLWTAERLTLARLLLHQLNAQTAQRVIVLTSGNTLPQSSTLRQDEEELNGYVWLLFLGNTSKAAESFAPLTHSLALAPHAAGLYWSARCAEADHNDTQATMLYQRASHFPTTFYGQLALAHLTHTSFLSQSQRSDAFLDALRQRLKELPALPPGTPITRPDLAEAGALLQRQGDYKNATLFLSFLQGHTDNIAAQQSVAHLALVLSIPKAAILASRTLARHGLTLYPEGYPIPEGTQNTTPTSLPIGLLQALIRQESSADPYAISPRQAIGLMQLLVPTAKNTARQHTMPVRSFTAQSLTNPALNIQIGTLYLQDLLTRFNQTLPYALAGYNAGPLRAQKWRNSLADSLPAPSIMMTNDDQILHWIMIVPYQETRHYIEHIETDMSLYAVLLP